MTGVQAHPGQRTPACDEMERIQCDPVFAGMHTELGWRWAYRSAADQARRNHLHDKYREAMGRRREEMEALKGERDG